LFYHTASTTFCCPCWLFPPKVPKRSCSAGPQVLADLRLLVKPSDGSPQGNQLPTSGILSSPYSCFFDPTLPSMAWDSAVSVARHGDHFRGTAESAAAEGNLLTYLSSSGPGRSGLRSPLSVPPGSCLQAPSDSTSAGDSENRPPFLSTITHPARGRDT
jgi:hypothetical protein